MSAAPRYCYCCWQEDSAKQQTVLLTDEKTVVTESAMESQWFEDREESDSPFTFTVKYRRKGRPLSIDRTDIHNVGASEHKSFHYDSDIILRSHDM